MSRFLFCIPGQGFSHRWLTCWTICMGDLLKAGHQMKLNGNASSDLIRLRNELAGGDSLRGPYQMPHILESFDYDYQIWIDSDQLWTAQDVLRIVDLIDQGADMVSGLIQTTGLVFPIYRTEEEYVRNYHPNQADMEGIDKPFEVFSSGMGFVGFRRELLAEVEYPWFERLPSTYHDPEKLLAYDSEDVSFCRRVRAAGKSIVVDPLMRIPHEKECIL